MEKQEMQELLRLLKKAKKNFNGAYMDPPEDKEIQVYQADTALLVHELEQLFDIAYIKQMGGLG